MDDRGLDEFKGEVDFDFFDDDSEGENKPKKDAVLGKPPAARKSPKPPTPSQLPDLDLSLNLKTSEKKDDLTDSDSDSYSSYSSDSSVTGSDSDSGSKTKQKSADSMKKDDKHKHKVISRSASSSEDSMSKSYSESESDTESFSKVSSVQTSSNIKTKSKSKQKNSKKSENERDDASAYSDSQSHSDVESESKPVRVPSSSKRRERPMTSKNSLRNQNADAWTNGLEGSEKKKDIKQPSSSDRESRKGRSKKKERYSDSESEITDVSPLNSAPNSPREKKKNKKNVSHYNRSNGRAGSNERKESLNEPERLDLNVLVDAVSELDKDKRIKANTRRVMFAPPKAVDKRENYSYTHERANMIEKENRRLLNEILQHVEMRDKPPQLVRYEKPVIRRLTPSAINREREQRKIESENLAFLRRLKNIKPTKGMSKAEHEQEYEKTMLYGVPISMAHGSRPKSRSSTPWDEMSMTSSSRMGSRTRSLTSVHSAASSTIGSTQSTFRRPTSAKRSQRAEWNDRW